MLSEKEKSILKIIKLFPLFLIITFSIICSYIFFIEHNKHYVKETNALKEKFIYTEKTKIKNEVERIYEYISFHKSNSENELKELIKNQVEEAHFMMSGIYETYKNEKSKDEIIKIIKASLNKMRYLDGRGYFYIYDLKGNNIFHPILKFLEGKSLWEYRDITGKLIIQNGIKILKEKKETFDEWYWEEPTTKKVKRKIGFHKMFEPYNIFIGSGEYIEDFEEELKDKILEYIGKIKYIDNQGITIINQIGTILTHTNKDLIGKNVFNLKNSKDFSIYKEIIALSKTQSGYLSYEDTSPINKTEFINKISYIKALENWNWIIFSSFYKDSVNKQIQDRVENLEKDDKQTVTSFIVLAIILTLLMLLISYRITKILEKNFLEYRKRILEKIEENREKDNILAQQSKMAAMGEMIANIAHQWKQPLSVISTAVTGLKFEKEMGLLKDEDFNRGLDSIYNSVIHLSSTIDDFRNFFKPNKEKKVFDLKNIVEKTSKLISSQFDIYNIYFVKNIQNVKIFGQENELVQVMINLLNNAKDALKDKEGKRLIFIDIYKEDKKAFIVIKDTAGGIPSKNINKIFNAYFTTKGEEGTGIGLYMSKNIIEKSFESTIKVENSTFIYEKEQFSGAKFTIAFSCVED
ncbi:cache domain-containing protein [Malaciobacter mytili]|uniref:sensor histidine kinase n=1 Tax=Malaciobacter mytili TaxID=603050 RepID=UPI003A88FB94